MKRMSPYQAFGEPAPVTDMFLVEHVCIAGETITGLAHRYYDDWMQWRLLADRNRLFDPRRIEPGMVLLIPERPLEMGAFESA